MRLLVAAAAAAAAAVAAAAAPAAAEPVLVLERCTALDAEALRAAILHELAARPDPRRDELILAVQCPDAVTARLALTPPPPAAPVTRSLDLGEVPGELRIKLLAVAAAELIDGAVASRHPPPAPAPIDPGPARPALPGERLPGSLTRAGEVAAPAPAPRAHDALVPRLGLRVFPAKPVPLAHLALDYERRWFAVGVAMSIGSNDVALGSVSALLVTAGASTPPLCAGAASRACLRARGELGLARAKARPTAPMVVAHDARAPYAQLGLALDLERAFGSLAALVAVEAGWAHGLIATSQAETAIQLDGAVFTMLVGLRWRP